MSLDKLKAKREKLSGKNLITWKLELQPLKKITLPDKIMAKQSKVLFPSIHPLAREEGVPRVQVPDRQGAATRIPELLRDGLRPQGEEQRQQLARGLLPPEGLDQPQQRRRVHQQPAEARLLRLQIHQDTLQPGHTARRPREGRLHPQRPSPPQNTQLHALLQAREAL